VECGVEATDVDHIVADRQAPERRLDRTNLRSLCHRHHSRLAARAQIVRAGETQLIASDDDRLGQRKGEQHYLSDCLRLDKENDGGRWLLTYGTDGVTVLRLRISAGGRWDWFLFVAEMQHRGSGPIVLSRFDVAPAEIIPRGSNRYMECAAEPWNPYEDEPDFLAIPDEYHATFAWMVRVWGQLAALLVPAPAQLTIH